MKRLAALLLLIATTAFSHDELAEQVHAITLQIARAPNRAELYFQRGELYRADSHWKQAERDYRKAKELAPGMAATDLGLGLLYLNSGRLHESKQALDRFIAHQPDHAQARVARGHVFSKLGNRMNAVGEYSKALMLHPDPEIYIEKSQLLLSENKLEEALIAIDQGIRTLGPIVTMELFAIDVELRLEHYDQAVQRVDRIAAQSERKEAWFVRKGEIFEQALRNEEARKAYLSATEAIADLPPSRKNTGYTRELEERIRHALERLEKSQIQ